MKMNLKMIEFQTFLLRILKFKLYYYRYHYNVILDCYFYDPSHLLDYNFGEMFYMWWMNIEIIDIYDTNIWYTVGWKY